MGGMEVLCVLIVVIVNIAGGLMVGIRVRIGLLSLIMWVIPLLLPRQMVLAQEPTTCSAFPVAIMQLSQEVPFSVTSWIRTPKRNGLVGGVSNSKHLRGLAVDIVLDDWNDALKLLALVDPSCIRVGMEVGYIHLEAHGS